MHKQLEVIQPSGSTHCSGSPYIWFVLGVVWIVQDYYGSELPGQPHICELCLNI